MNARSFQPTSARGLAGFFARRRPEFRWLIAIIATSLSVGLLMAAVVPAWIAGVHGEATAPAKIEGVATQRFDQRMPIYELPPVFVEADRKTELAKIQREERLDRIDQARSRTASKPPV